MAEKRGNSRPPPGAQGRRTMQKLLDAAVEVFQEKGYHSTSVDDIAERAMTSHGTFYLYFSNKEGLLRELIAESLRTAQQLNVESPNFSRGMWSWDDLRRWVGEFSSQWAHYAPIFPAWMELARADKEFAVWMRSTLGSVSSSLGDLVARSPIGSGVDPGVAGTAIYAMLDRFHGVRAMTGGVVDETDLDALTTLLYRALFGRDNGVSGRDSNAESLDTFTASAAQKDLPGLLRHVHDSTAPVVISSTRGDAVLLSRSDYESLKETAYLMHPPNNARRLTESLEQAGASMSSGG